MSDESNPYIPLARHLISDRFVSEQEIKARYYPHADRDLVSYRMMVPSLDRILVELTSSKREVRGLDVGCGTGRAAAELMDAYPNLDMRGITLILHPPVAEHKFLSRDRIKICRAGNAGYPDKSFDFLIAVGSLDTSGTILEEGKQVLKLVDRGGYFIFAPTVWYDAKRQETEQLEDFALDHGFSSYPDLNDFGIPYFIFHNNR